MFSASSKSDALQITEHLIVEAFKDFGSM